jgi:hypothetical protein
MVPRVAIVLHRQDRIDLRGYWLGAIAACWRAAGTRVDVVKDPATRIEADVAILHTDLTVVPVEYVDCAHSAAVTVNGGVRDISKRAVSAYLVGRDDRYDGPVIVKTNRNDRGKREVHAARKGLTSFPRPREFALNGRALVDETCRGLRRWRRYGSLNALLDYPIFDSMASVPEPVWEDEDFVVERFLPERRGGRYCVRTWLFFGDRERHALFLSDHPIVKSRRIDGYERLGDVPEELRKIRSELKFDFGKFDYTMVDDRPVLFDANRTPSIGDAPGDRYLPIAQSLAEGIGAFLQRPAGTLDPASLIRGTI